MCSQFEAVVSITKLAKYTHSIYDEQVEDLAIDPHIYPHTLAPVVINQAGINKLVLMSYSLVPYWSKTSRPKFATYNARLDRISKDNAELELIYNLPTWKKPFKQQHCIVPLAGFYESCPTGYHAGHIVKFSSIRPDFILLAAGIWDRWVDHSTGEVITSFAILTDDAAPFILKVGHDRQPVFINQENANLWLNSTGLSPEDNYKFLKSHQEPVNYLVTDYKEFKRFKPNDLLG
jgi:putative SOS response-associated peptidase YedK